MKNYFFIAMAVTIVLCSFVFAILLQIPDPSKINQWIVVLFIPTVVIVGFFTHIVKLINQDVGVGICTALCSFAFARVIDCVIGHRTSGFFDSFVLPVALSVVGILWCTYAKVPFEILAAMVVFLISSVIFFTEFYFHNSVISIITGTVSPLFIYFLVKEGFGLPKPKYG